jgi:hypothetical protein
MYQEPRTKAALCRGNATNAVSTEATVPDRAEFGCNRVLRNIRAQQDCPHGELLPSCCHVRCRDCNLPIAHARS